MTPITIKVAFTDLGATSNLVLGKSKGELKDIGRRNLESRLKW